MFIPMQTRYEQDYYPPLASSRSPSPRSRSPSPLRSPSLAPSSHFARRSSHAYPYRAAHAPPAPPTSIPLDDNFDAPTTAAPSEWGHRRVSGSGLDGDGRDGGDGHPEYDESVTGYQNYVVEMERMLAGQMESAARAQERMREAFRDREHDRGPASPPACEHDPPRPTRQRKPSTASVSLSRRASTSPVALRRIDTTLPESVRGSSGRRSHAPMSPPPAPAPAAAPVENARQVSGKKGRLELVEQRIIEDSAARTISLWRERVAASSVGGSRYGESNVDGGGGGEERRADGRSEAGSHAHRRLPSGSMNGDPRLRRVVSDHARYASSAQGGGSRNGKGTDGAKRGKMSYERSEYIVSYNHAKGGIPDMLPGAPSEAAGSIAHGRELRTPSSPTTNRTTYERAPPSPTLRRHAARKSMDRSEFTISYPNTPPLTGSQASSGSPSGKHARSPAPPAGLRSPLQGSFRDMRDALPPLSPTDTGALKATTTSSVEAILAACDPSLLHIAPVLHELGIRRVDHLRAVARLSEETRDREVKEQALRRGVSVVEWAIFLDKLQTL